MATKLIPPSGAFEPPINLKEAVRMIASHRSLSLQSGKEYLLQSSAITGIGIGRTARNLLLAQASERSKTIL